MKKNGLHIDSRGNKIWYKDGLIHRDDAPDFISFSGDHYWFKNGKYHREGGPAIIYADGRQLWYKEGKKYQPSAHELMVWKMNEKEWISH